MSLRIGTHVFDTDRRPLVVARSVRDARSDEDLVRWAKDAIGRGADLVSIPVQRLTEAIVVTLDGVGAPVIAGLDGSADGVVPPGGVHAVSAPPGAHIGRTLPDAPVRFATDPEWLRPGDVHVVGPGELGALSRLPPRVRGIVDLGNLEDRARIAALVVCALEAGAAGFVTVTPVPVRRAAHVVRAVERAT